MAVEVEVEVVVVEMASDLVGDTIAQGTNPRLYFCCCIFCIVGLKCLPSRRTGDVMKSEVDD